MIAALRRDGEPDVADHAWAIGLENFLLAARRNRPRIAIAARAVEAGLLERL